MSLNAEEEYRRERLKNLETLKSVRLSLMVEVTGKT